MLNKNLFIEGDNIDALHLLQKEYTNKIKVIYIDPPNNSACGYLYKEPHAVWLDMIKPRLELAKNLLKEDGAIFISIDDSEQPRLRLLCDSIFEEENFIATIIWEKTTTHNTGKFFMRNHEYIICYAKNRNKFEVYSMPHKLRENSAYMNPDNDPRGAWQKIPLIISDCKANNVYAIVTPSGNRTRPPSGWSWSFTEDKMKELRKDNRIYFNPPGRPTLKYFLNEAKRRKTPLTLWRCDEVGPVDKAGRQLRALLDNQKVFERCQPVDLIKKILTLTTKNDDIVLDFFAGSATTAHAVMEKNSEDTGKRKYIMVQLPEPISVLAASHSREYDTVVDVAIARIKRAAKLYNNIDKEFLHYRIENKELVLVE